MHHICIHNDHEAALKPTQSSRLRLLLQATTF